MKEKEQEEEKQKFYRVKVVVRLPKGAGGDKVLLEGLYLPKGRAVDAGKLKRECSDLIRGSISCNDEVIRDMCEIDVTYKAIENDFVVVEGKPAV
ncbi:MAG: hypothetical protein LBP56_07540 [Odoribacteraceae bacterium]|jgi:hypothetical protein|nr:hypothetical protein [Odoribacteraceae bacterium]